jgi:hypothetical protein
MRFWPVFSAFFLASAASAQISEENVASANRGYTADQGRSAAWHLDDHRKLAASIATLKPQRPGVVDAFVISVALDGDDVFGREAAEAARVLSRRYDAVGRTITLAPGKGAVPAVPNGSPPNLSVALAAVAQRMDLKEDVLVLYATTHGGPRIGLAYKDDGGGFGAISPLRLAGQLNELGISKRLILISACYAGQFVAPLATPESAIVVAADETRTSFGCAPSNDWTFFGDALINTALRKPQALDAAVKEAFGLISGWEYDRGLTASQPRSFFGSASKNWIDKLEARMPKTATPKTGKPAISEIQAR